MRENLSLYHIFYTVGRTEAFPRLQENFTSVSPPSQRQLKNLRKIWTRFFLSVPHGALP